MGGWVGIVTGGQVLPSRRTLRRRLGGGKREQCRHLCWMSSQHASTACLPARVPCNNSSVIFFEKKLVRFDDSRREAERQERLARAAAYEEAAWVRGEAGSGSEEEEEEVRATGSARCCFFWQHFITTAMSAACNLGQQPRPRKCPAPALHAAFHCSSFVTRPLQDLAEEEQLVWYCMACEKHFKSEAAFDNHERSKKHLQQVGRLGRRD